MDLVVPDKKQKEKKQKVMKDKPVVKEVRDKSPLKQKDKVMNEPKSKDTSSMLKSKVAEVSKISLKNRKEIETLSKKLDKVLSKLK
jgi:hypothetical protein